MPTSPIWSSRPSRLRRPVPKLAVAAVKSAINVASEAYEGINKAVKQVAEVTEANVVAATEATLKAANVAAPKAAPRAARKAA